MTHSDGSDFSSSAAPAPTPASADDPSIVIVEDEPDIADLLALYFRNAGWLVHLVADGDKALAVIEQRQPAFVILDIGLPGSDGLEICQQVRTSKRRSIANVPILFLTARDSEVDRILGLEIGADDYVVKPFSPGEIVARVKAILRRGDHAEATSTPITTFDSISVDVTRREATVDSRSAGLATQEFSLLAFLLEHQGQALTRDQILQGGWGEDFDGDPRTVDVHIRQLRKKLGPDLPLATVRGVGYRLG